MGGGKNERGGGKREGRVGVRGEIEGRGLIVHCVYI